MAAGEEKQANAESAPQRAVVAAVERATGWQAPPGAGAAEAAAALWRRVAADENAVAATAHALRLVVAVAEGARAEGVAAATVDAALLRAARAVSLAGGAAELQAALRRLVTDLQHPPLEPQGWSAHLARRAGDYIRRHYHRRLTLEELARETDLSPTYFCALFKREWGIGFRRFLQEVRLAEARRLLSEPGHTVEAVANAVGFEDVHYFTRVFRRVVGVPPGEYRRRRQQEAYREPEE